MRKDWNYIIPTVPARRQRGIELWESAGRTLGVLGSDGQISAHANGGIVGKEVIKYDTFISTQIPVHKITEKTEKETVPTNVVSDKSGVCGAKSTFLRSSIYQIQMTVMLFGSSKRTSRSWLTILEAKLQQCSAKLMRIRLLQHKEGTWERY